LSVKKRKGGRGTVGIVLAFVRSENTTVLAMPFHL
jgi:hypothetical protein